MKIAIMGHGVVGSAVAQLILQNAEKISASAGEVVELAAVLSSRKNYTVSYANLFVDTLEDILNNADIGIVVECIGGTEPAYSYVRQLLCSGRAVVTSNKELVAQHGTELLYIAKQNDTNIFFEASVGGGIPIIKPLHDCLGANRLTQLTGILNGTTNFILTEMFENNISFEDALELAQQLGYAEKNPSADLDGHDAARKLAILSSIAYGMAVDYSKIPCRGIREVTLAEVQLARAMGYTIKLIARSSLSQSNTLFAQVSPCLINSSASILGSVKGVFNALSAVGDAVGEVVLYGRGAGGMTTASAVVADVIDACKSEGYVHTLEWISNELTPLAEPKLENNFFVRLSQRCRADAVLNIINSARLGDELGIITEIMTLQQLNDILHSSGIQPIQVLPCIVEG